MSFDIFLQRFENGELAAAPKLPVLNALRAIDDSAMSVNGTYTIKFSDGVDVEFSADGLESQKACTSCAFHIQGFSHELMKFILILAQAGDMVIFPATEDNIAILSSETQRRSLPPDVVESFNCVLVNSPSELEALLTGGMDRWLTYRDKVT